MLGFGDVWVALAYFLCIGSTLLCVIYGYMHWDDEDKVDKSTGKPHEEDDLDETI